MNLQPDDIKTDENFIIDEEIFVDEDVEYQIIEEEEVHENYPPDTDIIEYEIVDEVDIKEGFDNQPSAEPSSQNSFDIYRTEKRKYDVLEELENQLVPEEMVECYVCDYVSTTYRELKNHYRSHQELVCKVCFKTFDKKRYMMNFTRHYHYIHLSKEKRLRIRSNSVKAEQPRSMRDYSPLECFSCDHIAANSKERVDHSRLHRGNHICKFCEYNSKFSWTNLKRHMITIHSKRIDTLNKSNPYINENFGNIYKREDEFSDLSDLDEEDSENYTTYPKICLCCEFIINTTQEKVDHYKEHEEYICKMCGYNAKSLFSVLKDHVIRVHNESEEIIIEEYTEDE